MSRQVDEWWRERGDMVAFALQWEPFGGGDPGDILVNFGIAEDVYFKRLQSILDRASPSEIGPSDMQRLRRLCAAHLDTAGKSSSY